MDTLTYEHRLKLPLTGEASKKFFTITGVLVAIGYKRVVIGDRGPYVEFDLSQLASENLVETKEKHFYYVELRTSVDNVKVYVQTRRVSYADYVPSMCYVSPFELHDDCGNVLIERLQR